MSNIAFFLGAARSASAQNMSFIPAIVEKAIHKECRDPEFAWFELLSLFEQRRELNAHKIRPEDVMGIGATFEEVEAYIERSLDYWAGCLAWGDFS